MNETKERILGVAQDLFTRYGYDKVSLREVAEQVGVTKAALYYHFSSKEEILKTLVEPLVEVSRRLAERLQDYPTPAIWSESWIAFIDWILDHRGLFELLETNQATFHSIRDKETHAEFHELLHSRLEAMLADKGTPLEARMRIAASLGAVVGVLAFPPGNTFAGASNDQLRPILIGIVNDILRQPEQETPTTPS
jgi:AcrR family transcriptional regulator